VTKSRLLGDFWTRVADFIASGREWPRFIVYHSVIQLHTS